MTITDHTEAEIAWAAGLFEGEGCIALWRPPRRGGCLVMNMTDYDVLAKFLAIVEVGRLRGPIAGQRDNHKPYWEWRAGKWPEVEAVLHEFYPWLGERRRAKADAAYAQYVWESAAFVTKDACRRGHPLDGPDADVRVTLRGGRKRQRQCRVCARLIAAEQRAQRRAAA